MKLSIGMAHFEDFDGVYFTAQALKMYSPIPFELIVVDNSPHTEQGKYVANLIQNWSGKFEAKYVPMATPIGTSQSRNRVFQEATGDLVLCIDCHVLLAPGSLESLVAYYERTKTSDLLTGPLLYDDLHNMTTHFDMVWRGEMWGVWAGAWMCKRCGHGFSCQENQERTTYHVLDLPHQEIKKCEKCHTSFPSLPWPYHPQKLLEQGYKRHGFENQTEPLEIPANGLGLFAAQRESWLGFNEHFTGFGGEEGYIHYKYKQAGRRTMSLPALKWGHRFGRPGGIRYPLNRLAKVRNYLIGFQELGLDTSSIHGHFVKSGLVPEVTWNEMVTDPIAFEVNLAPNEMAFRLSGLPQPPAGIRLDEVFEWLRQQPRDLNDHMVRLRQYASQCDHVTEFAKRRESTVALLAGRPKVLRSFQLERDVLVAHTLHDILKSEIDSLITWTCTVGDSLEVEKIEDTDMLFIDTQHNAARIKAELDKHGSKVSRFIVFHDTTTYGMKGDDGGPGLLLGIKQWVEENPQWFVMDMTPEQHGLLVLGCQMRDKPPMKLWAWPPGFGPGTELKKLLKRVGIVATENCSCNARANVMDVNGPQWCRDNMDQILDWLSEEAQKRKETGELTMPFIRAAAKVMVKSAIRRAEKQENG